MLRQQFCKIGFGLKILALALLLLFILVPAVWAQGGQGPDRMNFQGRLLDDSGNPLDNATRCLRFRMCSDSGCTTQVWPASGYEYHAVTTGSGSYKAGLFTTTLGDVFHLTPNIFQDHDTLYLEIGVSDSGTDCNAATYATLSPTSPLRANAFAQRSRRVHDIESDADYLIDVQNNGAGGAIYSKITGTSDDAAAGYFDAAGSSGSTYGLYAKNDSASDLAVAGYFWATNSAGTADAVSATSAGGYGVVANGAKGDILLVNGELVSDSFGGGMRIRSQGSVDMHLDDDGDEIGWFKVLDDADSVLFSIKEDGQLHGKTLTTDDGTKAGYFEAAGTSGRTYGIDVVNQSSSDDAVAGRFKATGASGETYAVYAENRSGTGVGVYGYGRGGVGGKFVSYSGNLIEGWEEETEGSGPTALRFKVDYGGYVYADGSYNCGLSSGCFNSGSGADVAERIDVSEALQPGDVVEIDLEHPGRFRKARTPFSVAVAGVISTSPGVTMGNNFDSATDEIDDSRPLLALVGVVPVKVCDENGPILPGDLLAASSTPGRAMRAGDNPPQGAVIGKALTGLDAGTGVIQMLVTLQ